MATIEKTVSGRVVDQTKVKLATLMVLLLISFVGSVLLYSFIMAITGFAGLLLHVFGKIQIDIAVFDLVSLVALVTSVVVGLASFMCMSKVGLESELPKRRLSQPHVKRMKKTVQPRADRFSIIAE